MRQLSGYLMFACLVSVLGASCAVRAQEIVGFSANGTMTATQIEARNKAIYGTAASSSTSGAVELFKVRYRSRDDKGRGIVLSGLVMLPQNGASNGLVLYCHGTTADRNLSPSRYHAKADGSENELAALTFASGNYAVALPDYQGLGDDTSAHPFPLGKINARAAIDLISAARALASARHVKIGARLFVTGYSEGGGVAMWTVRELENLEKKSGALYHVAAAAPMAGPYDLSGATRESLLSSTNVQQFAPRLYLLAYSLEYYHRSRGVRLIDFFKPAMAATANTVFRGKLTDENIIKRLTLTAVLMRAQNQMDRVLNPQFLTALRKVDTRNAWIRELQSNDCFDWAPHTKMLLICLKNDQIVVAANTQNALNAMRKRGVSANLVRQSVVTDNKLNHITAIVPSFLRARRFFDGGFAAAGD